MDFGVSTSSLYPQLSESSLKFLGENGVQYCEFFTNTFSEITIDYIKEFKKIAEESNIKIVSLHPFTCPFEPYLLFTGYERRFRDGLDFYKHYFEIMNILGSKIFVFHGDRAESQCTEECYFERFATLCDLANKYDITFAQENVSRCKSRDLDFLIRLNSYMNGNLKLVFDNKQAVRSNISYQDFFNKLGDNIVHVHISDNGKIGDCLPIGDGDVDFCEMFSLLKRHSFNGKIIVELYRSEEHTPQKVIDSYYALKAIKNI